MVTKAFVVTLVLEGTEDPIMVASDIEHAVLGAGYEVDSVNPWDSPDQPSFNFNLPMV